MGYVRYVGRVGALAVALGVGSAVATMPGVALAEPSDAGASSNSSSSDSSSSSASASADNSSASANSASSSGSTTPSDPNVTSTMATSTRPHRNTPSSIRRRRVLIIRSRSAANGATASSIMAVSSWGWLRSSTYCRRAGVCSRRNHVAIDCCHSRHAGQPPSPDSDVRKAASRASARQGRLRKTSTSVRQLLDASAGQGRLRKTPTRVITGRCFGLRSSVFSLQSGYAADRRRLSEADPLATG